MKLTAEKVEEMIKHAEQHGFTKESVYKQIKMNKTLHSRANEIADAFWNK